MTNFLKAMTALGAAIVVSGTPAFADYTILEDTSMPSVLYVDFEDTTPAVISAPKPAAEENAALADPALPPVEEAETAPIKSIDERIEERMKKLEELGGESIEMPAPEAAETMDMPAPEVSETDAVDEVAIEKTAAIEETPEIAVEEIVLEEGADADVLGDAELR